MTERDILESTYTDTCTIKRHMEVETEWGETKLVETIVYENVKCAMSKKSISSNNTTQTVSSNNIQYVVMLFISPNIEVLAGDKVFVLHQNKTYDFDAGEGFYYSSHAEIPLLKEDEA